MQAFVRNWNGRRQSIGFVGTALFLVGAVAVLLFLAVLAALSVLAMAVVGVVIGAERLLGLLVPSYRRRRQGHITMPTVLIRTVGLGSRPTQVLDAHSYELPRQELRD